VTTDTVSPFASTSETMDVRTSLVVLEVASAASCMFVTKALEKVEAVEVPDWSISDISVVRESVSLTVESVNTSYSRATFHDVAVNLRSCILLAASASRLAAVADTLTSVILVASMPNVSAKVAIKAL